MDTTKHQISYIERHRLHPSPTNPRRHFGEVEMDELSRSIEAHGIIQPMIVRRSEKWSTPGEGEEVCHYEIVAGERRWRAGSVAGLEEFPVIVRELSDRQVIQMQLIENLQRVDVSPYEEATGYAALLDLRDDHGRAIYSVEMIAEEVAKSLSYVRNRLRVQRAPKALLDALSEGRVGVRVCELVGRIPHEKDREKCAVEVLEPKHDDEPMTFLEVQEHIRDHYMVSLNKAPFDRGDEGLVPEAGSCVVCPHRSGNDPDLQEDLSRGLSVAQGGTTTGTDPHVCLNPTCFRGKCAAHYRRLEEAKQLKVLPTEEARGVFCQFAREPKHDSRFRLASAKPGFEDVGHFDQTKVRSWGDYAASLGVEQVAAVNPHTGETELLVDRVAVATAEQLAAEKEGRPSVLSVPRERDERRREEVERERMKRETAQEEVKIALDRLSGVMKTEVMASGALPKRVWLVTLRNLLSSDSAPMMAQWMGLKGAGEGSDKKVEAIIARASDEDFDVADVLILIAMVSVIPGLSWVGLESDRFAALAATVPGGIDVKAIRKAATAAVKDRQALAKAKASVKAPVKGGKGKGK